MKTRAVSIKAVSGSFALLFFLPALLSAGSITVDGVCTLTDAILAANADAPAGSCTAGSGPDTIVLDVDVALAAADTVNSTLLFGNHAALPDITTVIRIEAGAGSVIERDSSLPCERGGADHFRLLNVPDPGGELTLSGLTLRNGCATVGGALAIDDVGPVFIEDSTFEDNGAYPDSAVATPPGDQGGGAIVDYGFGQVEIRGSHFEGNFALGQPTSGAGQDGGAASGGAVLSQGNCLLIADSTFVDNRAEGGSSALEDGGDGLGGGLKAIRIAAPVRVRFEGNVAKGGRGRIWGGDAAGGGLWAGEFCAGSDAEDLVFIRNSAVADVGETSRGGSAAGGGLRIQTSGASQVIFGLVAEENQALGAGESGTIFGGSASGGAVSGWGMEIHNASLLRNIAMGGDGEIGGRAAGGALDLQVGSLIRSSVAYNLAQGGAGLDGEGGLGSGGGLSMRTFGDPGVLRNSVFYGNVARGGDGGGANGVGGNSRGGGISLINLVAAVPLDQLTVAQNLAVSGAGTSNGGARAGGLEVRGPVEVANSILAGNLTQVAANPATANDCRTDSAITSNGFNLVEAGGNCVFGAGTDQLGVDPLLLAFGRYGCTTPLPNGLCVGAVPLALASPAIDQGSCSDPAPDEDVRGLSRPWDFPAVANLDDGCDVGSYEARDEDGNGIEDGLELFTDGFETGDTGEWTGTGM